jgi:hypothetical protein
MNTMVRVIMVNSIRPTAFGSTVGITAQIKASGIYSATGEGQGERHISYLVSIGMVIAEDWGELDI